MPYVDLTSENTIKEIISGRIKWPHPPWKSARRIDSFYRRMCSDICRQIGLKSRNVFNNYGSGYASYLDAWFYKDAPEFRRKLLDSDRHRYVGLWVLLNRYTPFYVMGEGVKSWSDKGGSSYLPMASLVDRFNSPAVEALSARVEEKLSDRGMIRLRSAEIMRPIPKGIEIETVLSEGEFRLFDALFHWMD